MSYRSIGLQRIGEPIDRPRTFLLFTSKQQGRCDEPKAGRAQIAPLAPPPPSPPPFPASLQPKPRPQLGHPPLPHGDSPTPSAPTPQATPPTRELLEARKGITHRDIAGEREADLIRRYQAGDRHAGEILLLAHAPFIEFQAKRWGKMGRHDLAPEDVANEARLGFLRAVEKFEPSHDVKLLSYAGSWIRSAVSRAIANTGSRIRVPVYMHTKAGRESDSEIGRDARAAFGCISLDAPLGADGEATLGDLVSGADNPEANVTANEWNAVTAETLAAVMARLPPKHAAVLQGIAEGKGMAEIGREIGLTRARIQQIRDLAMMRAQKLLKKTGRTNSHD